jgi:hypothetical protein
MFSQRRTQLAVLSAVAALPLLVGGSANAAAAGHTAIPSSVAAIDASASLPCKPVTRFDRHDFSHSTEVTNKYFPLVPGTQFILDGTTNQDGQIIPRRVVFTVTDLTKVIDGVRTVVIWDRDFNSGKLIEAELALHAQDNGGNVWAMGEYPEEYDSDGAFTGAPNTWIAGLANAKAGNLMPAKPQTGTRPYLQGSAPNIDFLDCGQVAKTGQNVCVPVKCYTNVLVVDEWSPLAADSGHQLKYHAPGVGVVKVSAVADPEGETLSLTKIVHLNADGIADAREQALKLEKRAYEVSDVYRKTPHAR